MAELREDKSMPHFGDSFGVPEEDSLDRICDMVLESIRESYQSKLEPWELFEQKKRAELRKKVADFEDSFVRGFVALLKELQETK